MKICIKRVELREDGQLRVSFGSDFGEATGFWQGSPPLVDESYHVELGIRENLHWDMDIQKSSNMNCSLTSANGKVAIRAKLDSVADDGLAFLRLGKSLVMVETSGAPPEAGSFVDVVVNRLELSSSNI